MSGTITIINENGEMVEREVVNRGVAFVKDADLNGPGEYLDQNGDEQNIIEPAVAQRVEWDHKGVMSQIMTVCGETENRREGDNKPNITVEGIVTDDNLEALKTLEKGDEIIFVSDVDQNKVIVKRVSVEQSTDIVHFTPDGGERKLAFGFQVQLKYPE